MTQSQGTGASGSRLCMTFACAAIGGAGASYVSMPLPWVMGSMLAVALFSLLGEGAKQPQLGRRAAQVTIGTALGLSFTQEVIREVASFGHWMILGASFALLLTMLFAPLIQRLARLDGATAVFSVALGASAEMAMQAHKAGANGSLVASAHAIRIILVVSTASFIASMAGDGAVGLSPPGVPDLHWQVALLLAAVAPLFGWMLHRLGMPNAWVLGPLFLAGIFAAFGLHAKMFQIALILAQIMIGWGLGQHMTKKFFIDAPRMLVSSALVTLSMLMICLALSWALAESIGITLLTSFLSIAPGGMAEMAIIAKAFGIGAPIVTAFHFFRILSTIFLIRWIVSVLLRSGWVKEHYPHKDVTAA